MYLHQFVHDTYEYDIWCDVRCDEMGGTVFQTVDGMELLPCIRPDVSPVWISSGFTGGDFASEISLLAAERETYLLLEPLCHTFRLPDPSGMGHPTTHTELHDDLQFSNALQCFYCAFVENGTLIVQLLDDKTTIAKKLRIARDAGVRGMLYRTAEDLSANK